MQGFGIDVKDANHYGDESDPRICGHEMTGGAEDGGRTAMEKLLQKCPDVNVMYTINEPAAAGGYEAIKAAGKEGKVLVVSIDGGCPGVKNVRPASSARPRSSIRSRWPSMALEAIVSGKLPEGDPASGLLRYRRTLITDKPVNGVPSIDTAEGLKLCWG